MTVAYLNTGTRDNNSPFHHATLPPFESSCIVVLSQFNKRYRGDAVLPSRLPYKTECEGRCWLHDAGVEVSQDSIYKNKNLIVTS